MKIVVLCGGLSPERDVSLSTAAMSAAALRRLGHEVTCVDLFLGVVEPAAVVGEDAPDLDALRALRGDDSHVGDGVFELCQGADLVFMALHGADGEDGKIQAALDLLGVKYTGSGSFGSALAMNKAVAKTLLQAGGVRVARGSVLRYAHEATENDFVTGVPAGDYGYCGKVPYYGAENVPLPFVVKPCSGGSSVGTTIVFDLFDKEAALAAAFAVEDTVLVEEYIVGRECDVGVIAGRALPPIEIATEGFYDYKSKYQAGLAVETCPADFPQETTEALKAAALRVFELLHLEVYARMDFIVAENGEVVCLEANTLPGLTPTSLMPQEAAAEGIAFDELIALIVSESLKKYGVEN